MKNKRVEIDPPCNAIFVDEIPPRTTSRWRIVRLPQTGDVEPLEVVNGADFMQRLATHQRLCHVCRRVWEGDGVSHRAKGNSHFDCISYRGASMSTSVGPNASDHGVE